MKIITTISALQEKLTAQRKLNKVVGFVPTMGALHEGHIHLLAQAQQECDVVVVSIFVNPTQFNNIEDLKHYPRKEEEDLKLLEEKNCDFVFLPSEEEIYPPNLPKITIELGVLGLVMEGAFRPGHFDGVVNVVARLFTIINPNFAYFGRKDFQQVAVVKEMVRQLHLPVKIHTIEVVRESSGLALSSRNQRLSEQEKENAVILSSTLKKGVEWAKYFSPQEVKEKMIAYLVDTSLQLEYLEIVHPDTLKTIQKDWVGGATACVSVYCGIVRLIDNMELIEY